MISSNKSSFALHETTLYNGCRISYIDQGNGPQTILFIHGLATYSLSWQKNIEVLSSQFRCVAIDLPGNGSSGYGDYPYSMNFFASCIIDFIGRLKLEHLCIAGHSMGGQIALRVLLDAPECAQSLILCAPAGFEAFNEMDLLMYQGSMQYAGWLSSDEQNLRQTVRNSFYKFPKEAGDMINDLVTLMQQQPGKQYRSMLDKCITGMLKDPVWNSLNKISHPSLVLFGDQDALIPNRMLHPISTKQLAQQGVQQMQHATLHILPNCGHFLQWEMASQVNHIIKEWLLAKTS